jgi:16S rRNA (cytosine967-C5)-methyltransferase
LAEVGKRDVGKKDVVKSAGSARRTSARGTTARPVNRPGVRPVRDRSRDAAPAAPPSVGLEPRRLAYDVVRAVADQDAYANLLVPALLRQSGLTGRDAALATELAYGSVRLAGTLEEIVASAAGRPLAEVTPQAQGVLRVGAYQILCTRIPPHAAVASSVDLVRSVGGGRAAGFVNAVLRRVTEADWAAWIERLSAGRDRAGVLALNYAHPPWVVSAFGAALNEDPLIPAEDSQLEQVLAADNERPIVHLVAWPGRITVDELITESAVEEGAEIAVTAGTWSPYAARLTSGDPARLPAIASKRAAVQDEGSQLCALALAALPLEGTDARWLDLCAGPGGKAALLAGLGAQRGALLVANELHPHRVDLVRRATEGWPVDIRVGDARALVDTDRSSFDRVLLDAPCSGLGALRRRPESRWRRSPEDVEQLMELQGELLRAAIDLVRPGGVVAYVTCSPHLGETVGVVSSVAQDRDVEILDARSAFAGVADLGEGPFVQLWPHRHGTDAMFFAALRRRPAAHLD